MAETVVVKGGVGSGSDWHGHRKSEWQAATETNSKGQNTGSAESIDRRTLTDIQVAARLGVSRFTVRSWRLKGLGPRFLKMGRAVRYRPEDVDEYERQALVETQASADHSPM